MVYLKNLIINKIPLPYEIFIMTKIKCSYLGDFNCEAIHLQSGTCIKTDAPLDHCGKGLSFSPTDLLATSLGSCLITIMAIKATSKGIDLKGIYLNIEKSMAQHGDRKIKELKIDIFIPKTFTNKTINFLKKASEDCPVRRNLSKEIDIKIHWEKAPQKEQLF